MKEGTILIVSEILVVSERNIDSPANGNAFHGISL
jgi:hypothetical protein